MCHVTPELWIFVLNRYDLYKIQYTYFLVPYYVIFLATVSLPNEVGIVLVIITASVVVHLLKLSVVNMFIHALVLFEGADDKR